MEYKPYFFARHSAFSPYRMMRKEMGFTTPVGSGDAYARSLYCGMKPIASWDCEQISHGLPTGGVYNLEFSPEGSLLVAACEKKCIQIFDPLNHKRIHSVHGAHSDCVNCVKFLDGRMFATCSDDTTIALWDVRNLKKKIRSLFGHSNWVKNIEFSFKDKLLVTSGLDGSIYTWDINSYTEYNLVYQRVFHASGLMRCRLSPDARQMVMCTTGGLLVIIHDLNLSTLAQHLHGFKPNLYRLMQMSQQLIPIAAMYDHLFDSSRKENRIEFVSDFPDGNDAKVVSSLQIHPQGWSALSRNISHDDRSEWSCIHDIQPYPETSDKSTRDTSAWEARSSPRRVPARRVVRRLRPRPRAPRPQASVTPATPTRPNTSRSLPARRVVRRLRPRPRAPRPQASVTPATPTRVSDHTNTSRSLPARRVVRRLRPRPRAPRPQASVTPATPTRVPPTRRRPAEPQFERERDEDRDESEPEPGPSAARPEEGDAPGTPRLAVPGLSSIQNDVWEASITIKQHRTLQEMYSRGQVGRNFNMQRIMGINTGIAPPTALLHVPRPPDHARPEPAPTPPRRGDSTSPSTSGQTPSRERREREREREREQDSAFDDDRPETRHYIRQNRDRLLYYIEETNEGKGFIKELCYSKDGRIVCSPFGRGMRLLALDDSCSELSALAWSEGRGGARPMREAGQVLGLHQDLVVSSKFNPRHHMLVTGCLEGRIVWYEPHSGESMY
ncbi:DDB1- and CUL4-associated factor 10 homolog [Ostrinia nubilalis]|uniref:DDB1- and CUL4-associated factor 10 homolog n=1 Tax=Ostrinia nubilalis TaxID=29057 RepID=UPI00308247A9